MTTINARIIPTATRGTKGTILSVTDLLVEFLKAAASIL
jgi:hypothetical protein